MCTPSTDPTLSFLTGLLNRQTQHKSSVGSKLLKLHRHCIAARLFSGRGREFEVNAGEEEKADARLERRRETKAGKHLAFLHYASDSVMQFSYIPQGITQRDVAGWEQARSTLSVWNPQQLLWAVGHSCQGMWAAVGHRAPLAGGHQGIVPGVPSNSQAQEQSFSAPLGSRASVTSAALLWVR